MSLRVKITQEGSLLPVWFAAEISEAQAEEIGRIVTGGCHLPIWRDVFRGICTHADHAAEAHAGRETGRDT